MTADRSDCLVGTRNLTLESGNRRCRQFRGVRRCVVEVDARCSEHCVALVVIAAACSNESSTPAKSVDSTAREERHRRSARRHQGHHPSRWRRVGLECAQCAVRRHLQGHQGVLREGQPRGRHLRPQARAGLRTRRPDDEQPQGGAGRHHRGQRVRGRSDPDHLRLQRGHRTRESGRPGVRPQLQRRLEQGEPVQQRGRAVLGLRRAWSCRGWPSR